MTILNTQVENISLGQDTRMAGKVLKSEELNMIV